MRQRFVHKRAQLVARQREPRQPELRREQHNIVLRRRPAETMVSNRWTGAGTRRVRGGSASLQRERRRERDWRRREAVLRRRELLGDERAPRDDARGLAR